MAGTLAGAGHDVIEAHERHEELRIFLDRRPAVIITDIPLPTRDGNATILELRREPHAVQIIAISGGGHGYGVDYLAFASKPGADLTLSKPFKLAMLEVVNDLLPD